MDDVVMNDVVMNVVFMNLDAPPLRRSPRIRFDQLDDVLPIIFEFLPNKLKDIMDQRLVCKKMETGGNEKDRHIGVIEEEYEMGSRSTFLRCETWSERGELACNEGDDSSAAEYAANHTQGFRMGPRQMERRGGSRRRAA